jgi:class 3 adenylate cyclase
MKTKDFGTISGPGHPPDRVMGFYRVPSTDWYLVLVSRGSAVLAPIVQFRSHYLLAMVLSLVCVGLLIERNTRPIADSVTEISKAAEEVEKGDYSPVITEDRTDEIGMLKRRFNLMIQGLRERDLIEQTFGRYVDRGVAAQLLARPELLEMGGTHQTVSVLMADLRGFTRMCETLTPSQVIAIMNRHFSKMIEVAHTYSGIIVDFFGDSILVFFGGSDRSVADRALDAVACALKMQTAVEATSRQNVEQGLPELSMGVGIHTGDVIVGNIGSEQRAKYGIVGSAVNETDRIQAVSQGGTVLISEQTYKLVADAIQVEATCKACLKGLDRARDLFEVRKLNKVMHQHVSAKKSQERQNDRS